MTLNNIIEYFTHIRDETQAGDMKVNLDITALRNEGFMKKIINQDTGKNKEISCSQEVHERYDIDHISGFAYAINPDNNTLDITMSVVGMTKTDKYYGKID